MTFDEKVYDKILEINSQEGECVPLDAPVLAQVGGFGVSRCGCGVWVGVRVWMWGVRYVVVRVCGKGPTRFRVRGVECGICVCGVGC